MTSDQHDRVYQVFLRVCDLPVTERDRTLDDLCGDDLSLRKAVLELLAQDTSEHGVLNDNNIDSGEHLPEIAAVLIDQEHLIIGPFTVIRKLGQGAMGIVYEAEQVSPNRRVAVKIIHPGYATQTALTRFRREAEVLGMLQHPGIAQIFESGMHDDRPYIAMELIDGDQLTAYAESNQLDTRARLELIARIADATHHAHQKGVIHRDLKPENILVVPAPSGSLTGTGLDAELVRIGQPKILDFGIARAVDGFANVTNTKTIEGQLIGTLAYMSPEQILGDPDIDTRTDIYALGIIAYELLSGRLPVQASSTSLASVLLSTHHEHSAMLGTSSRKFRGDIETIVAKAMEPDRDRRYQSAAELAADIRRHLDSQPIEARPQSLSYQFNRFARRNRGLVIAASIAVLAVISGTVLTGLYATRNARLLHQQESMLYVAMLDSASRALAESDIELARRQLAKAPESFRGWEWNHLVSRTEVTLRKGSLGDGVVIPPQENIVWRSDAQFLVPAIDRNDNLICYTIDARSLEVLERIHISADISKSSTRAVMINPAGDQLVLVTTETDFFRVRVYTIGDKEPNLDREIQQAKIQNDESIPVTSIAGFIFASHLVQPLIPEGSIGVHEQHGNIAALPQKLGAEPTLGIIDIPSGRVLRSIPLARRAIGKAIIMPSGTVIVPQEGGHLQAFDLDTGDEISWKETRPTNKGFSASAHTIDPNICVLATRYGELIWIDARYGEIRAILQDALWRVQVATTRPGSNELFSIDVQGHISVWRADRGDPFALHGHDHWVDPLVLADDGTTLITGDWEGSIRTWDLNQLAQTNEFRVEPTRGAYTVIDDLSISPDGRQISVVSSAGWSTPHIVEIRDRQTGDVVYQAATIESGPTFARFHPDGRLFVTTTGPTAEITGENTVYISNARSPVVFTLSDTNIAAVVVHNNGLNTLRIFESDTLSTIRDIPLPRKNINTICFSPDGTRILTAGDNREVHVWDRNEGVLIGTLSGHTDSVLDVAWSPDSTRIATASRDSTIGIWDGNKLNRITSLRGHQSFVNSVAWSPDGTSIITTSSDRSIRIWSTQHVAELKQFMYDD